MIEHRRIEKHCEQVDKDRLDLNQRFSEYYNVIMKQLKSLR